MHIYSASLHPNASSFYPTILKWNVEEVVSLIDLVRDLTNGDDNGVWWSSSLSLGEGLPLLDPLLDDVPSPYDMVDLVAASFGGRRWRISLAAAAISIDIVQQQQLAIGNGDGSNNFYGAGIFNQWQSPSSYLHYVRSFSSTTSQGRERMGGRA